MWHHTMCQVLAAWCMVCRAWPVTCGLWQGHACAGRTQPLRSTDTGAGAGVHGAVRRTARVTLVHPTRHGTLVAQDLSEFNKLIRHHKEKTGLPVIVDFYSDGCGPCRQMAPIYKKMASTPWITLA